MSTVATSATRAMTQTDPVINGRIERQARASVAYYAEHPGLIGQRLEELDREWDLERWLELNSAALSLIGLSLAATRSRWWLLLPLAVQGFFLQHSIQGWCPPVPGMRRLGVRTPAEIQAERHALKALRGDFKEVSSAEAVVNAAAR